MEEERNGTTDVFAMIMDSVGNTPIAARALPKSAALSWSMPEEEGQLAVDVLEEGNSVFVLSTMAGADASRLEVTIHNDLLTIRGVRHRPLKGQATVYHEECFWGRFSRTIVLPVDVKPDGAWAEYVNGVLTVRIPKRKAEASIPVIVVDE